MLDHYAQAKQQLKHRRNFHGCIMRSSMYLRMLHPKPQDLDHSPNPKRNICKITSDTHLRLKEPAAAMPSPRGALGPTSLGNESWTAHKNLRLIGAYRPQDLLNRPSLLHPSSKGRKTPNYQHGKNFLGSQLQSAVTKLTALLFRNKGSSEQQYYNQQ